MPSRALLALAAPLAVYALEAPSFEDHLARFGLSYPDEELPARRTLYRRRLLQIAAHNSRERRLWTAGVNGLTAATEEELAVMRGHRAEPRDEAAASAPDFSKAKEAPPSRVDWREHLPTVVTAVKDQGQCGSCWAFASTEVVETHIALTTGVLMEMAPQQVVSCTPTPSSMPDAGGCAGLNAERGLAYVSKSGIDTQWRYPYLSGITKQTGECMGNGTFASRLAGITGFSSLPGYFQVPDGMTQGDVMKMAVAQHGPIAVTVAAGNWHFYASGIFDGCDTFTVNLDHAVVLMGYGEGTDMHQGVTHWWLVRNSWGTTWGEKGYIRLARYPNSEPCGFAGGLQLACGECGVLASGVYPVGGFLGHRPKA